MLGVPISPDQVPEIPTGTVRGVVFDVTNELILKNCINGKAIVMFSAIEQLLKERSKKSKNKTENIGIHEFLSENFQCQYKSLGWIINYYIPKYRLISYWYIEFIKKDFKENKSMNSTIPKTFNDDIIQTFGRNKS